MADEFIAPCTKYYGCAPESLSLYARDGQVDFLECGDCRLIWRDTGRFPQEREYDREYFQAHRYDQGREHRVSKANTFLAVLEQFVAPPGRLLEVGPAFGYNLEAAARRGWEVEGIDISDVAREACREFGLDVQPGKLTENDKPDGRYRVVLLKHVLEHYADPGAALKDAWRLLAPGGAVQIFVPNADYARAEWLRGRSKFYSEADGGVDHFVYFRRRTLARLLRHTGFSVVQEGYPWRIKGEDSWGMRLERIARRALTWPDLDKELMVVAVKN